MAVTVDATSTAPASAGASRTTMTWSHTVASGATLLVVAVTYAGGGSVTTSSVTYGGVPLTGYTRATSSAGANNRLVDLWYIVNPTPGTASIVVTQSGSNDCDAAAISWKGTSTSTPLGTATTQAGATGTTSGPLATSGGAYVIAAAAIRSTAVPAIGGAPTVVLQRVTGAFNNESNAITYQAVAYSPSWSWATGTDENAAFAVPINAASTSAPGIPSTVIEVEFTAGVWTDVSTRVQGDSIEIKVGRESAAGGILPGTLDCVVDNPDGVWTPDNPLSSLYPNLIEGKRIRVKATKGAASSYRFVGRLTAIEPDYPSNPELATTRLGAVDLLGELRRMSGLPSMSQLASEAACRTNGGAYWPMTDSPSTAGVLAASFRSGTNDYPNLTPVAVAASPSIAYASDNTFPGGGAECVALSATALLATSQAAGWAQVGGWFYLSATSAQTNVLYLGSAKPTSYITGSGPNAIAVTWTPSSGVLAMTGASLTLYAYPQPGWHYIAISGVGTASVTYNVDGVTQSSVATPTVTPILLSIGGVGAMSVRDICTATPTSTTIIPGTVLDLARSLATITSDIATVLTSRGLAMTLAWSDTTDVSTQPALMPLSEGKTALDLIVAIANSQSGIAYATYSASATQTLTLVATRTARPTAAALTLDVEADLDGGPTLARDVSGKQASATANGPATTVTATDITASADGASVSVDTALKNANSLWSVATDQLAQSRYARLRIVRVVLELATAVSDRYAAFFATSIGNRLRMSNLPTTYFGTTYADGYILGWTERPGIDGYPVSFNLAAADAPAEARFDDATFGRFAWGDGIATVTGGTCVGVTGTGTLIIATASGPTLTTSAGAYPLQLDWNGECVTIGSAPASSVSPQTVTVTARGQNGTVARTHGAGEQVEIYMAARFAL